MQLYAVNFIPLLSSLYMCLAPSGTSNRDNLRQPMIVPVAVDAVVLLMIGLCAARNMYSELSREIKFTAYSCICYLFQ